MLVFGAILTFFATSFVSGQSSWTRIVNGTDARKGEIPYIVSLRYQKAHQCGASILDETHILTAAHCVYGKTSKPALFSIQYGLLKITNDNSNSVEVSKIVHHPQFRPTKSFDNDVAVLTLAGKVKLGGDVKAVVLSKQGAAVPENSGAVLAGWGFSQTGGTVMKDLQRVDLKVYTSKDCTKAHDGNTDQKYHICAGVPEGGKGQCSADSGGPLTVSGVQYGVVSWSTKPCAAKGKPGVFANVAQYVDWIKKEM